MVHTMVFEKKKKSFAPIQSCGDYIQKKKYNAIMVDFHKIQKKNMTGYSKHLLYLHKLCHPNPC
jgi:hypothetical protein